jgi:hypothetical protein
LFIIDPLSCLEKVGYWVTCVFAVLSFDVTADQLSKKEEITY